MMAVHAIMGRLWLSLVVRPKLHASTGVQFETMKKQITAFILGSVIGSLAIFAIGADSKHPEAWDYKVIIGDLKYDQQDYYTDALKQVATNGWEIVSTQAVPKTPGIISTEGAGLYIVLRHAKQ